MLKNGQILFQKKNNYMLKKNNETMYKMCQLSKSLPDGAVAKMNSWIREKIAIKNSILDNLEDTETGVIENNWKVDYVMEPSFPESMLLKKSHGKIFGSIKDQEASREHAKNRK